MPKYITLSFLFVVENEQQYVSIFTSGLINKAWGCRFITLLALTVSVEDMCLWFTWKYLTQLKGGITVNADSLYQQTAYCKLWEEFDCGSKVINFTAIRVPFLNIFLVPIYPRNFWSDINTDKIITLRVRNIWIVDSHKDKASLALAIVHSFPKQFWYRYPFVIVDVDIYIQLGLISINIWQSCNTVWSSVQ